jgi:hypothetical protein
VTGAAAALASRIWKPKVGTVFAEKRRDSAFEAILFMQHLNFF